MPAGSNWYVNGSKTSSGNGTSDAEAFKTLNEALNNIQLQDGDTIMIASGEYKGTYNTGLVITKNLNFITYGNDEAILDARGLSKIWTVTATSINITGLTFKNGKGEYPEDGGAIYFKNALTNSNINAIFINNSINYPGSGGAIYFRNITNTNINAIFINNTARWGGGAIYIDGSVSGNLNGTFINNTGNNIGGAIYIDGSVSGNLNGIFINNTSGGDGGAINIRGDVSGNLNGTFINNTAWDGGAIASGCISGNLNGTFINNTANVASGGAIASGCISGNLNGTFINNTANNIGGAITIGINGFSGNITGIFINNTSGGDGGAIHIWGDVSGNLNGTFINNTAKDGGAINCWIGWIDSGLIVIRNSIFISNTENTIHIFSSYIDIVTCLDNTTGNVTVTAYGKTYNATIVNGNTTVIAQGVTVNITSYFGDKKYTYTTVRISLQKPDAIIDAPDVTKYYGGSERFAVTLKDLDGNPITNANVKITINGNTYTKNTDNNGKTSIGINLNSGVYNVTTEYNGTKVYSTITVKDTVIAKDVTKIFRNGTQYQGTFVDSEGNLVKNTDIEININGVFYTRTTDANGMAQMNINLPPGTYILTATNPVTGEQHTTIVTVLPNIVENYDVTKYYKNASQYSLRLLDDKGNPVGAGVSIQLNINGVFYTRTSDANGYVKMNINLPPGTYIITAEYKGLRVSNTIKVLTVLETKDLVMKYRDGSQFKAKVLDGQGRPYAGQTVTYNINGVFYTKTTDGDGIAALTINLPAGEYIITSMYNGLNAANKVTIIG